MVCNPHVCRLCPFAIATPIAATLALPFSVSPCRVLAELAPRLSPPSQSANQQKERIAEGHRRTERLAESPAPEHGDENENGFRGGLTENLEAETDMRQAVKIISGCVAFGYSSPLQK